MKRKNNFYESLKCILTNEEKQELGEKLALAVNRIRESQDELKSCQTQIKSAIATDEAVVASCSEKIRSGYEFRKVECEEIFDYENNIVEKIRLDTKELMRTREMEPHERQKNLPLDEEINTPSEAEILAAEEIMQDV